jgi:hypothetical protein
MPNRDLYRPGLEETGPRHLTEDECDAWLAQWRPPCAHGRKQRLASAVGYCVLAPDRIGLFVMLTNDDAEVCAVSVAELADQIQVSATACCRRKRGYRVGTYWHSGEAVASLQLASPLGDRIVLATDTGDPLEHYVLHPWRRHTGSRWRPMSGTGPELWIWEDEEMFWPPEDAPWPEHALAGEIDDFS